jgi:hypothetical protein
MISVQHVPYLNAASARSTLVNSYGRTMRWHNSFLRLSVAARLRTPFVQYQQIPAAIPVQYCPAENTVAASPASYHRQSIMTSGAIALVEPIKSL